MNPIASALKMIRPESTATSEPKAPSAATPDIATKTGPGLQAADSFFAPHTGGLAKPGFPGHPGWCWGNLPKLPVDGFQPAPKHLTDLENRFKADDGHVSADEARSMLREAMKDGKLDAAEQAYLKKHADSPIYRDAMPNFRMVGGNDGFDQAAKDEFKKVTDYSGGTSESASETSDQLDSLRNTYRGDDGRIDLGEAKQVLREAVNSGKTLTADEVKYLQSMEQDRSLTKDARAEISRVLSAIDPSRQPTMFPFTTGPCGRLPPPDAKLSDLGRALEPFMPTVGRAVPATLNPFDLEPK